MKKIFTLIAVAAMAISAQAQNVVQWKAVVDEAPVAKGGEVVQVKDGSNVVGSIAFGTTDNWQAGSGKAPVTYNDVTYSFTEFFTTSSTNGNGGDALKADGSDPYNYVAFVPNYSGTFILVVQNGGTNNTSKPLWTYENGEYKAGTIIGNGTLDIAYDGHSDIRTLNDGNAVNGGIKYSVTAGKTYTFSVNGSKARWAGFIFDYDPATATGIQSVKALQQSNVRYNLAGQQVDENYKGVVIVNGQKLIQK